MLHSLVDWAAYEIVRLSAFITQRLRLETAIRLGSGLGALFFHLHKKRAVAYANLKAAFPKSTPSERLRWTKDLFRHLGMMGVEVLRFPTLTQEETERLMLIHGYERYVQHYHGGKGLILLTAHLGNWEYSQVMEGLRNRPMMVLARKQKHPRLDGLLNSFRERFGSISIGRERGDLRDLIQGLRDGKCLGVLGDQAGGEDGVEVRFFGRLTTAPRGPMALALKVGVPIFPVFCTRREGPHQEIFIEPPLELVQTGDSEKDIRVNTQRYIDLLESYITKYPSQWLWLHKRWKRTRTKRITLLSDGKPGHVKQSEAIVKGLIGERSKYETSVERIEIQFRGAWQKALFHCFAFFFIPWAQGRMHWLRPFFSPESAEKLEKTNPDFIVSTGSSLAPLNLCLARENLAKSVVVMKPSFPFNLFRYDLAFIPAHDQGVLPRESFRVQTALSGIDPEVLRESGRLLGETIRDPKRIRLSLFLGGETRQFKPSVDDIEKILSGLDQASEQLGGDYLITTSRRTPEAINQFLCENLKNHPRCQLCVIAARDPRPVVVPGMMALADYLVVTEDSLSMISEALSSGKPVVILKMERNGLPKKHYRFQEILREEWNVPVVEISKLGEAFSLEEIKNPGKEFGEERVRIREKLESLL